MNEDSIKTGCSKVLELLDGTGLDYIINNAAIVRFAVLAFTGCMMILALQNPRRDLLFSFDPAVLAETIKCNVTGPTLVTSFLLPAMENSSSKIIVNMSSSLASIN
ncbi:hypothetical protein DFJ58DRAFT_218522 [Suillus subalutaceus]|uniref:uncharacterized protein n=1 Tax=Suillus subalutaceus TaxID=48586 RepID=UPI001B887029|nr:uncharacterized protein DFJ58DRAFT_218522 [Suillus subalutaceus]KAG1834312.1 hypothetical protein DFJ58DRAFT_218522 [Suillus subalutaceus]